MPYLFVIDKKDRSFMRLLHSWWKPGPKHRQLPVGAILERPAANMLLIGDDLSTLQLIVYHKMRKPDDVKIYAVKELTSEEMAERISAMLPDTQPQD